MPDKNPELPEQSPLTSAEKIRLNKFKTQYRLKSAGLSNEQIQSLNDVRVGIYRKDTRYDEFPPEPLQAGPLTISEDGKIKNFLIGSRTQVEEAHADMGLLSSKDTAALTHFKKTYQAKSILENMGYTPKEATAVQYRLRKEGFSEAAILERARLELAASRQLAAEKPQQKPKLVFTKLI